jgi:nicotinamide mononucleotide adenylyltransferase
MQTQTIKAELLINGKKVVIGHQFLEDIVRDIPDIKENKEIFNDLVLSDNPDVREYLTRVDNIGKKSIHILLNDTNQEVVDGVLSNSDLSKHISAKNGANRTPMTLLFGHS